MPPPSSVLDISWPVPCALSMAPADPLVFEGLLLTNFIKKGGINGEARA